MSDRVSNFKLGLFIFIGTALLTGLVVMFGSGAFSPKGIMLETYVDGSVQGLDSGSAVRYRGVKIGKVTEINLVDSHYEVSDEKSAHYILVRMELDPSKQRLPRKQVEERIKLWTNSGMRLRVASQGITGISYMEAEFVDPEDDTPLEITWTPEYIYIPTTRTQLAVLADSIGNIAKDLEEANLPEIAVKIDRLLTNIDSAVTQAKIGEVREDIQKSLTDIQRVAEEINVIVSDPEIRGVVSKTSSSLDQITETAEQIQTSVAEITEDLAETLDETNGAVLDAREYLKDPELRKATRSIRELAVRVESLVVRVESSFSHKDQRIDLILSDIKAATANLRDLSELIAEYPAIAAFGETPNPSEVYEK